MLSTGYGVRISKEKKSDGASHLTFKMETANKRSEERMKKKVFGRILSAIMAASILFSQIPVEKVFAAEIGEAKQIEQQEGIVSETNNEKTGKIKNDEDDVTETVSNEEGENTVVSESDIEQEIAASEVNIAKLLNYVFVEKSYVSTPDVQNIMASIGTDGTVLESAILQYRNIETGEVFEVSEEEITQNVVLFTINHEEQQEAAYELVGMTYVIAGEEYSINFADAGMNMKYGVNKEVEVNPDEFVMPEDDSTAEVEANVVTTDEEGQVLSEQDIQQALQNSESSLPSTQAIDEALSSARKAANGNLVVVLDPGHDSTHAGTQQNGCSEEDMVFKIAQYCKAELEQYSGVTVYMTRDGLECPNGGSSVDSATCNAKRVEFAASKGANVYVSFHLNSSSNSSANGAGIYYPNASYRPDLGEQGHGLAKNILAELNAIGLGTWAGGTLIHNSEDGTTYPDGSLADYLGVIRRCKLAGIPAVLIEHAFVTNDSDKNNFLSSDAKLQKLGIADATAIAKYYGLQKASGTVYNGVDYAAVYDFDYYISKYSDIKNAYGNNPTAAFQHFVNYGMREGRQGIANFNVNTYKNRYVDLRNAYGNDLKSYYLHYIKNGQKEGRSGAGTSSLVGTVTKLDGVNYSAVFDYNYYINKYSDIKRNFEGNDVGALQHFVECGMKEGRQAKSSFQVQSYYNMYSDLRRTYGNDLKSYYLHYIQNGIKEGRVATGVASMQNCQTVYNGVDYSAVYDYSYYTSKYNDIKRNYGINDSAALKHFVEYGMNERRQGTANFQVQSYYNKYQDLRKAFGANWKSYYLHYIQNGKREGRVATGVTTLQNAITTYNGVNYAAVYDYDYYISKYADIKRIYTGDENAVIKHFVEYGMKEGRQGKAEFNVTCYRNNYIDLSKIFGSNLPQYYLHYINYGQKEGRTADKELYTNIMGNSQTSVSQMMAYYNANASYPTFYGNSDAPNLQQFCQIYLEECATEGVRAEVAFAQAMKETNFLRYTGDVKIEQYNFAGLGATGNGNSGNSFRSVREGIRAQVQHLKAYASTESLKNPCVDPRFQYVTRGTAPYVEWLGINENPYGLGWATDKNYGYNLKERIRTLLSY